MKETVIHSSLQSNLNSLIENTLEEDQKMEEDLNFFISDKHCQQKKNYVTKKIKQGNRTRIKSRNFLSNISNNGVEEKDLFDRNYIFDIYTLVTKNINPFSLE